MPAPTEPMNFSSRLALAFSLYRSATEQKKSTHVLLVRTRDEADELSSLLQSFIDAEHNGASSVGFYNWSAWEHAPFSPVSSSITQKMERLKTLDALHSDEKSKIILSSIDAWIQPTLPKEAFQKNSLLILFNEDLGTRDDLRAKLRMLGYVQAETVQEPGQFAMRGEILDLFLPTEPYPYRIEFFDTLVESIRHFHPETQRTLKVEHSLHQVRVGPAEEALFPWDRQNEILERIKEYCDQNQISRKIRDPVFENVRNGFLPDHFRTWFPFIYQKVGRLLDYLPAATKVLIPGKEILQFELEKSLQFLKKEEEKYPQPYWITPKFDLLYPKIDSLMEETFRRSETRSPLAPSEAIEQTKVSEKEIYEWLDDGFLVWVGTRGTTHQEHVKFLLQKVKNQAGFKLLSYDSGESLQFLTKKQIIISESLILGGGHQASKRNKLPIHPKYEQTEGLQLQDLTDLSVGDLVVHSLHGVGKYLGLQELKGGGKHLGEYLLVEYSGGDKLYLPVYRLNTIQRFVSSGTNPGLDKLGTGQFEKAKQKARESARKLAVNLLEIYAKRALLKGPRFEPMGEDYYSFCDQFEFTETEGQLKAVSDVLTDLEQGKLLDRLVCGDVGFGKTEVAIRAAFQAVQSGFQVAVLVPTTLLAFQHEQSFKRRMRDFPIRIESISRFKSKKIQGETLKQLGEGQVDILIGTHRLLSKDVQWNKLGLLVVDEEHRFGVDHKEKIKAIQANTHTLTLTATPIPRTLNMALAGLKDISVIKTPPTNRQPIKTYVSSFDEQLIKSAIEEELNRGGQVFYLYNRVQTIQNRAEEIQKLVPHAKISVAHGQMNEDEIESKMLEFYQGQSQVLVCTTIIESGIDVPNAGTILIHRADQLGLAQLYQIRGRVGRSHRKASAYLLVDEEKTLTAEAKMRLDVLQRFVELGSGFQIATYDLEIRGGGNFLGAEQSGHVASVGLDLFTELLEEAIQELRGQKIDVEERHFEPEIQVPVVCEISTDLIQDPKIRLSFYRKLSNAKTNGQIESLHEEIIERYGEISPEAENLFWLIRIKNLLKKVGIEQMSTSQARTSLTVRKSTLIDIDEVMKLYTGPKNIRDERVSITPDSKIVYLIPFENLQSHLFELEGLFRKIAPKAFENGKSH